MTDLHDSERTKKPKSIRWVAGKGSTVAHAVAGGVGSNMVARTAACGTVLVAPVDGTSDDWPRCRRCVGRVGNPEPVQATEPFPVSEQETQEPEPTIPADVVEDIFTDRSDFFSKPEPEFCEHGVPYPPSTELKPLNLNPEAWRATEPTEHNGAAVMSATPVAETTTTSDDAMTESLRHTTTNMPVDPDEPCPHRDGARGCRCRAIERARIERIIEANVPHDGHCAMNDCTGCQIVYELKEAINRA
jgi:hypothetical protein